MLYLSQELLNQRSNYTNVCCFNPVKLKIINTVLHNMIMLYAG